MIMVYQPDESFDIIDLLLVADVEVKSGRRRQSVAVESCSGETWNQARCRHNPAAEGARVRFEVMDARQHRPDYYADTFAGYKAVRLVDDDGRTRGELVWRLASGHSVEITEFGIHDEADRRQGWGTRLLDAGIASIQAFFADKPYRLRRVYLFCDSINEPGRRFYEVRGFELATVIRGFYHYCDAAIYVRNMEKVGGGVTS